MKTNRASRLAASSVLTLLTAGVACIAACSGNQSEVVEGADGGTVFESGITFVDTGSPSSGDSSYIPPRDTGTTTPDTSTGGGTPDTGTGTTDTGTGTGGGVCPSSCTTDSECAATCPATTGALNCCDTVTNACFTSAATSCPDQTTGTGGTDGGGY